MLVADASHELRRVGDQPRGDETVEYAQRDVLQRLIVEAAIRSGNSLLARALLRECLSVRGWRVYSWSWYAQVLRDVGGQTGATTAEQQATMWRERFAAARA